MLICCNYIKRPEPKLTARPYDVLLGRLGADRLAQQGRDPFTFPKSSAQAGCRFFPETQHNVCGDILSAWRASGLDLGQPGVTEGESLALFGLPLSDPLMETLSDGKQYSVQWFERGRFESHPENQPPFNVLLGLLGSEVCAGGSPPQQPSDSCADVPAPVSATIAPNIRRLRTSKSWNPSAVRMSALAPALAPPREACLPPGHASSRACLFAQLSSLPKGAPQARRLGSRGRLTTRALVADIDRGTERRANRRSRRNGSMCALSLTPTQTAIRASQAHAAAPL
jgi:hypothetical protein